MRHGLGAWKTPFGSMNTILANLSGSDANLDGLPTETPIALTGNPEAGKSILALELAYKAAAQLKGNIVLLRTEKLGSQLPAMWEPVFSRKYGAPDTTLYVEEALSAEAMLAFNGYKIMIVMSKPKQNKKTGEWSKPKKMPVQLEVDVENSPLTKYIRDKGVRVVIYDSLTAPFNAIAAGGQQNLPERFNVTEMFFQSVKLGFYGTGAVPITCNHVSYNPASMFLTRESFRAKGGKSIEHNHDYIFYLEKQSRGRYGLSQRTLWVQRHPRLKDWRQVALLWLDDDGYREMKKEEVEALKAGEKGTVKAGAEPEAE